MATYSGHERTAFYFEESTFGEPPADWDTGTFPFLCVNPQVEGLTREMLENANYRQRALASKPLVKSIKNGTISFGCYARGKGTVAAEDSSATTFQLARLIKNAWGGIRLGYATGISSGSASAPVVDAGEGTNYADGDWIFAFDTSASRGEFACVESISTDTLTLRFDLTFTPDGGGADAAHAAIVGFPNRLAMINKSHADHETGSFFFVGEEDDDLFQPVGVKLNLTAIEGLAPNEAPMLSFEGMCLTSPNPTSLTRPDTDVTLEGEAPLATSVGTATSVRVGDLAGALTAIEVQSFAVTPGIASQPIPGVSGREGRLGYTLAQGTADAATLELVVPYDPQWFDDFDADTRKHVLLQVGDQPGEAFGVYFPHMQIAADPRRGVSDDIATIQVSLRPLEYEGTTSETGNQLEQYRAKILLLMAA
jgi:hypothetical protein